ncbi:hypothetical protein NE237_026646 [Protea cynaroides]|uniref:Sm domain-containing protein n=1 Tax=Protea cynaroides TaxID=273540 RepID=A0A9Q0H5B4_9MAGN|nr:hypothetical protein NE237_026646 [Protea cynaroides]
MSWIARRRAGGARRRILLREIDIILDFKQQFSLLLGPVMIPGYANSMVVDRSGCPFSDLGSKDFKVIPEIFNWMQSKLSRKPGSSKPNGVSANHQIWQEPLKEEFSDWPNGLLAIGTFGNNNLNEELQSPEAQEDPSSSVELLEDFTHEEVGKLQHELTKLLSHKPVFSEAKSTGGSSNLPLDKFLNCPSSLEVDRTNCTKFCDDLDDKDHQYLQRNISHDVVLTSKGKDVCLDSDSANAIKKRSVSFLLKKMFACRSGFALAPNMTPGLRDPLPESRMEKLLRAILHKMKYPQSSTPASMKKYLENRHMVAKDWKEDDLPEKEKANDGNKWVKTDSECPEDVFLSTSLASYLDKKLLVLLRDGRKLLGILRSFDQFANAVLEGACERVIVGDLYCDIPLGLYVIRGENVVLIGELDLEREELPPHMTRVSATEIRRAQKAERDATDLKGTMRKRMEFLDLD